MDAFEKTPFAKDRFVWSRVTILPGPPGRNRKTKHTLVCPPPDNARPEKKQKNCLKAVWGSIFLFFGNFLIFREQKISPKLSWIKFFWSRDVPTQIAWHPGHSLSKTTAKALCLKFLSGTSRRLGPWCPRNILPKNSIFRLLFPSWIFWARPKPIVFLFFVSPVRAGDPKTPP